MQPVNVWRKVCGQLNIASVEQVESSRLRILQKCMAEFIGTYLLVFSGTAAIVVDSITHKVTPVGIAVVFGLVVMVLIYAFGHVSGAHFNPAVTIGFLVAGEISWADSSFYIVIQMVGAVCASLTLRGIFGNVHLLGATIPSTTWEQSFILEMLMSFILMTVILGSVCRGQGEKSWAGAAIGAAIALDALFGGPISGASMNPARSFGPAVVTGTYRFLWIYFVAPLVGTILASAIFKVVAK